MLNHYGLRWYVSVRTYFIAKADLCHKGYILFPPGPVLILVLVTEQLEAEVEVSDWSPVLFPALRHFGGHLLQPSPQSRVAL